jgi:hypothetical protein
MKWSISKSYLNSWKLFWKSDGQFRISEDSFSHEIVHILPKLTKHAESILKSEKNCPFYQSTNMLKVF